MTEQHIPIFVGSTFEDLQEYRRKVRDTLGRLETYVAGMEQFGATSQRPIEKCLAEVGKCKIYVGIFAMRYGSIPNGYDKSFTHLEYERAQELRLPSLIFIISEDASIPSKYVDKYENAIKLKALKTELEDKHTCDYFTTPEDLASKVATAVACELGKMKTSEAIEIEDGFQEAIQQESKLSAEKILKRAQVLPRRWLGVEFIAEFCNSEEDMRYISTPRELSHDYCKALDMPYGHSINIGWWLYIKPSVEIDIYAANEFADQIIDIDKVSIIKAKVETAYLYIDYNDPYADVAKTVLRIKEIINVTELKPVDNIPF